MLMRFQHPPQPQLLFRFRVRQRHEFSVQHFLGLRAQNVRQPARHTRTKIESQRTKHQHHATGHIFAAMLPDAFHNRQRATIANRKPLPSSSTDVKLPGSRAVQHGVSGQHIATPRSRRSRRNSNRSAGKPFADVIVRFPSQFQRDAVRQECPETLPRRPRKRLREFLLIAMHSAAILRPPPHYFAAEPSPHAAIRIVNRLRLGLRRNRAAEVQRILQRRRVIRRNLLRRHPPRLRNRHHQKRIHSRPCSQAVVPAAQFPQRSHTKLGHFLPHFLGQRLEIRHYHLRLAVESQPQFLVLRRDPHRTSIQVALPRHHATNRQQRRRPKSKFIRPQNRRNQDVPRKFQTSVHAERES